MDGLKIKDAQKVLCVRYGAELVSKRPDDKVGFCDDHDGTKADQRAAAGDYLDV